MLYAQSLRPEYLLHAHVHMNLSCVAGETPRPDEMSLQLGLFDCGQAGSEVGASRLVENGSANTRTCLQNLFGHRDWLVELD